MVKHCCYGLCLSDDRDQDKPWMEGVFFIPFPKPKRKPEKCQIWLNACSREGFDKDSVTKDTYICSLHFVGGHGPTETDPHPISARSSESKIRKLSNKRKLPMERGHTDLPKKKPRKPKEQQMQKDNQQPANDLVIEEIPQPLQAPVPLQPCTCRAIKTDSSTQTEESVAEVPIVTESMGTQTEYDKYILGAKIETMILRNNMKTGSDEKKETVSVALDIENVKNDDKKMKFFTGLTLLQFMALFQFLGDSVNNLKYWRGEKDNESRKVNDSQHSHRKTTPIQELFICLVRLRRGFSITTLSYFTSLSETSVRRIFTTWLQLLYCHFNDMRQLMFPDRKTMRKHSPRCFRSFKNVRCSVDCTEFFVEMPRNFNQQGNLYSNYKHHHTYKCLIAVAPNGAAVFVSDLYEGAISDVDIFAKCGILDYINPGDLIVADRGFTVEDLLNQRQAHLNIPAFLKGREKLTPQEELLTRKIAQARIHVERYNERLKKFRLVSGRMPLSIAHLANQAVFVTSCLVNFQQPLAK